MFVEAERVSLFSLDALCGTLLEVSKAGLSVQAPQSIRELERLDFLKRHASLVRCIKGTASGEVQLLREMPRSVSVACVQLAGCFPGFWFLSVFQKGSNEARTWFPKAAFTLK